MAVGLIVSEKYIKNNTVIDENVDMKLLLPTIWMAQERHVQEVVGGSLYKKLQADIVASTLTGNYLTLVDDYIAPALLWWVMYESDITLLYKYRNKNISKKDSENATPVDFSEHRYLRNNNKDYAEWWTERLIDYLCENSNDFPEYSDSTGDELQPRSTKYSSTVFLGHNKRRTIKEILKNG